MSDIAKAHLDVIYDILMRNDITGIDVENKSSTNTLSFYLRRGDKSCMIDGNSPWIVENDGGYMCGFNKDSFELAVKSGILMLLGRYKYPEHLC